MKKLSILLLTVALFLGSLALTASAESDRVTYYQGDTVTVTYYIPGAFGDIKSGSIEFFHDESAFELVDAKWELESLFIKDVNLENRRGVFAFKTARSVFDKVFTATYLVREDAAAGTYEFTANLQLQDNQSPAYTVPVDLSHSIEIVERASDDEYTPVRFNECIKSIDRSSGEQKLTAITEALDVYNALTDDEKAAASADYVTLRDAINSYNEEATMHNDTHRSATAVAYGTISQAFIFLSELVMLIVRTIFKM